MAGIASIGAGMVHVAAAADHSEMPLMMVGFELVAILQVALGCTLLWRRPSTSLLAGGLAMMIVSIALWAISRTVGLGFIEGAHVEPVGFRDSVCVLFELVACVGLWELLQGAKRPAAPPNFPGSPVAIFGALAIGLGVPAVLTGGHTHGPGGKMALVHTGAAGGHPAGAGSEGHEGGGKHGGRVEGHNGTSHDGGDHAATGSGSSGHSGHATLASSGHLAHPIGISTTHDHSAVPAADHTVHTAVPGTSHTAGSDHGTATGGSHGGSTGTGHTPPAGGGGGHPPGHGEHLPPPEESPPGQSLADVVTEPLDPVLPGRKQDRARRQPD
jgi:hypothetical protein